LTVYHNIVLIPLTLPPFCNNEVNTKRDISLFRTIVCIIITQSSYVTNVPTSNELAQSVLVTP